MQAPHYQHRHNNSRVLFFSSSSPWFHRPMLHCIRGAIRGIHLEIPFALVLTEFLSVCETVSCYASYCHLNPTSNSVVPRPLVCMFSPEPNQVKADLPHSSLIALLPFFTPAGFKLQKDVFETTIKRLVLVCLHTGALTRCCLLHMHKTENISV